MQTTTILYIIAAFIVSICVAYFQYYYKAKNTSKIYILLFSLKTAVFFLLLLLIINPTIKRLQLQNIKPVLTLLADNSKSILFFKENKSLKKVLKDIEKDKALNEKFTINQFSFGKQLNAFDSLSFKENETNIYKGINQTNELYQESIAPIVLLTDGNQTIGNDYEFVASKNPIYPIIFGDTVTYRDLKITQLNVNKYSYIKNKFPVEVLLNYEGKEKVNSRFSIFKNGKTVFTKKVEFSSTKKSEIITANLESTKEGLQYYNVRVDKIEGEKNIKNNSKSFSVEVIDEQTKVLVVANVLHPDLGAIKKAIESNKQRAVSIVNTTNFKGNIKDYQLVILYQPTPRFSNIINKIKKEDKHYFIITGSTTDWSFINRTQLGFSKNVIQQTENYGAVFNESFLTFLQQDIGFKVLPPLKDKYGSVTITKQYQALLHQNVNGIETEQPLLITLEDGNIKSGVLLGEGVWKWRATSFLNTNSFEIFDAFIGNIIQYLASTKKRNRLEVNSENLYAANSTIKISAFYTDKNYKFDERASLEITVTNTDTSLVTKIPFSLVGNSYQTEIENLPSGNYTFKVSVLGQNMYKYGKFKISTYQIEEQFTNANIKKLRILSEKTKGNFYFKDQIDQLKSALLNDKRFYTTQKSITKEQNLIDWEWILLIAIILFSIEWFVRKYIGKI